MFLVSVGCCQGEVTETGRSLVQRIPIEGGVSECDLMRQSNPLNLQLVGGNRLD